MSYCIPSSQHRTELRDKLRKPVENIGFRYRYEKAITITDRALSLSFLHNDKGGR